MQYTKTTFVDGAAPYLNADNLNKIGTAIEQLASTAFEPCTYSQESTDRVLVLTTSSTAPNPNTELPLAYLFVPTRAFLAEATVQTSWSETNIPIYDSTTNAVISENTIRANIPCVLVYDGTKMWYEGHGGGVFTMASASTSGTFNRTSTRPTGTTRLNYNGYLYATQMSADAYNSSATADIAEGYPVIDDCEPGDLICIAGDEQYEVNDKFLNPKTLGFVSNEYAAFFGKEYGRTPIACAGRLHVKVHGVCHAGDHLVPSAMRGHVESGEIPGCIVAQALADKKDSGNGKVLARIVNM